MKRRTPRRTLTLVSAFALLLGLLTVPASADNHQVVWTGQGSDSENCEDYEEGEIHWIFQAGPGHDVTEATLHVPGEDPVEMELRGQNNFSAITGFGDATIDEDGNITFEGDQPYVDVEGDLGKNPRLLISGFCPDQPPTGSILLSKTYSVDPGPDNAAGFTVTPGDLEMELFEGNLYCIDGLLFGDYVVTETTVPEGFQPVGPFDVTVDSESTCAERLAAGDDPDLTVENVASPVDLTVNKWKLSFADGAFVETDVPLEGFEFTLHEGSDDTGAVIETSTTDASGSTSFSEGILEVGETYTVCETGVPEDEAGYWTDGGCQTFTAELGEDVELDFFNAPRADVDVTFTDVTGYTSATIVCYDAAGNVIASDSATGDFGVGLDQLDLGDYSCDLEIRNGADVAE